MIKALIGLGSNLNQPQQQVQAALRALQRLPGIELHQHSRLYCSQPVGPQDQPDFINAVAELRTDLAPLNLLYTLQALELAAGRQRLRHWGERTLDLDILLIGEQQLALPELTVPHPELAQRAFVVFPLLEIAPSLTLPDGRRLTSLAEQLDRQALYPLDTLACNGLISSAPGNPTTATTGQAQQPGLL